MSHSSSAPYETSQEAPALAGQESHHAFPLDKDGLPAGDRGASTRRLQGQEGREHCAGLHPKGFAPSRVFAGGRWW